VKKIFLILIFIAISKGFYSQTTEKVTHSEIGCWNENNSKWEWDSIQELGIRNFRPNRLFVVLSNY
jgi:hypothetical protein